MYVMMFLMQSTTQPINQLTTYSDEELLQHYRSTADSNWLGLLLQRYTMLLLGVAMKYLKDKEQAQDAVQQVFLKALTHLPQGEIQNFKGWLYILMRNHCLQLLRDKNYMADEQAIANIPSTETDNKALQQQEHTLEQMTEALEELPQEQQQCITMFYLQKLSYQQITDRTGYSFMQVKSYVQNGKRNLKQLLLKRGTKGNG
jgi:RNA polymerase sigma factor (sigma-70 family)